MRFTNEFRREKGAIFATVSKFKELGEEFIVIIVGDDLTKLDDEVVSYINRLAEGREDLIYGGIEAIKREIASIKGGKIIFTGRKLLKFISELKTVIDTFVRESF